MGRQPSFSSASRSDTEPDSIIDLDCPFGHLDTHTLTRGDLRETAYELFFISCRSSPGFGGCRSGTIYSHGVTDNAVGNSGGDGSPTGGGPRGGTGMMVVNSRIKKALGLKTRRSSPPMRTMTQSVVVGSGGQSSPGKVKRPMTSAEIMRLQMRVTEQSDSRLRKTLMRTLVGQTSRRAETIILPLELLRQLKPSEFNDIQEYHHWQRRQLKILEAGLILHPSVPIDRAKSATHCLREIIRSGESKAIDTSKNSDAMRNLCSSVVSLAWRSSNGTATEVCHWADGYPVNVHLYLALLQSVFDLREETVVLDEVDELLELMKKTWSTLGINRMIHNACFAWVFFQQYIMTGQVEPDLLSAALAMLEEVANDAKRADHDTCYFKVMSGALVTMHEWAEKRMLDYHESFDKSSASNLENFLCLALSTTKIISEDVGSGFKMVELDTTGVNNSSGDLVEYYINSSMRNAFSKILENGMSHADSMIIQVEEDSSQILAQLAKDVEQLALFEKETFSPVLKRWHPVPIAFAVAALHDCFGVVLKKYLVKVTSLTNELVRVLHSAGKLEAALIQMVAEDSEECEDGEGVVTEMVPYEVESIVLGLLKKWIEERLRIGKECVNRAKETESWIPKSKTEPYAQSAVDLVKLAKTTVDEFFDIPVGARDDMVRELADGWESIFQDYTTFLGSCGTKQSYIPTLPSLTRCNQESRFIRLWKKAVAPFMWRDRSPRKDSSVNGQNPRPSTSRGTQRLYIRLNTLHYLLSHLHSLDKSLLSRGPSPSANRRLGPANHLDLARSAVQSAIQHVSEVTAHRLIFLDSHHCFYNGLYINDVANSRIRPGLRNLKQNLTLLVTVLTDRAQPLAVKEVMKAAFDAFLMVLLAGGIERAFSRADHVVILEDFKSLKRVFCMCGEGLVAEEVVEREAEVVEGIVGLMGEATEQLVDEFSVAACEASGLGAVGDKVPMPPTTGRWSRAEPNTILRVLCHRNDDTANQFLKKTFQLAKRR